MATISGALEVMIVVPTTRLPDAQLALQAALAAGALLSAAAITGAFLWQPALALLPLATLIAGLLLINAQFRTAFLVFGGMAALQSSQELDAIKVAYFLGVGFAGAGALFNVWQLRSTASARLLRPLILLSLVAGGLLALTAIVSLDRGTSATAWLRDVAPYGLFAVIPVFALDVHSSSSRRKLVAALVIAGLLASAFHSAYWLDRRQLAQLPFEGIGLPSAGLRSAIYVYAVSAALLGGRGRIGWTLVAALALALTWITGNRGGSIMLPGITVLIGLFAMKRKWNVARPTMRMSSIAVAALGLTAIFMLALNWFGGYDTDRLLGRFESVATVSADPSSDGSYRERSGQTSAAWDTFSSSPVLGAGPGHVFDWLDYKGDPISSINIDTGLAIPAKFGIAGVIVLLGLLFAYLALLRNAGAASGPTIAHVALVAFFVLAIMELPFSTPLEDKGFSFGLLLLLALSLPIAAGAGGAGPTAAPGGPTA